MTAIEKKKVLKKIIDQLPDDNLDEAIFLVEDLIGKHKNMRSILLTLLEKEKELFKRLAE